MLKKKLNSSNGPMAMTEKLVIRMIGGEVSRFNKGFWMVIFCIYNQPDKEEIFHYLLRNKIVGKRLLKVLSEDYMKDNKIDLDSFLNKCRSKTIFPLTH